ncbi:MAG TPA: hypothetical protein VFV02_14175, partial [Acidimicrobiales bacterium]|nr:hypothetical protein [Acidimicrobiales bacterium]
CGYLVAGLEDTWARQLQTFDVDRIGNALRRRDEYLVVTVDAESIRRNELEIESLICDELPDIAQIMSRHLVAGLGDEVGRRWAEDGRMKELLASRALMPFQVASFATEAVRVSNGGGTLEEAISRFDEGVEQKVQRFLSRDGSWGDQAFITALAVFNGGRYQDVLDAASLLEAVFGGADPSVRQPFATTKAEQLMAAYAESIPRRQSMSFGRVTLDTVQFTNQEYAPVVLDVVWQHPAARGPVLAWLKRLAEDPRPRIRLRASMAIGRLSLDDFGYVKDEVLARWASARNRNLRESVGWILTIPASEPRLESAVHGLLREWSRPESSLFRKLTVATTYGMTVGLLSPRRALRELRRVAASGGDARVVKAVRRSLENLFEAGHRADVLEAMSDWTRPSPRFMSSGALTSLECLALTSFLWIADRQASGSRAGGPTLPNLLVLARDDPRARWHLSLLWRMALHARDVAPEARSVLRRWVELADRDEHLLGLLSPLVDLLARTDWEVNRLDVCLRHWAEDPSEPLMAANQLRKALIERRAMP